MGEQVLERLGVPVDCASYLSTMDGRTTRPADVSLDTTRAMLTLGTQLLDLRGRLDRIWPFATADDVSV